MEVEGRQDYYQSSESENEAEIALSKQQETAKKLQESDYMADFDDFTGNSLQNTQKRENAADLELIEQLIDCANERKTLENMDLTRLTSDGQAYIKAKIEILDLYMSQIVLKLGLVEGKKDLEALPVSESIEKMNKFVRKLGRFDGKMNREMQEKAKNQVGSVSFQEALERSESEEEGSEEDYKVYPNIPRRSKASGKPDVQSKDDPSSVRMANSTILKSKGLVRKRKRTDRNPRVKNRAKFDRAVKKRRNTYGYKEKEFNAHYDGERTGIRKDIVRSTKLT